MCPRTHPHGAHAGAAHTTHTRSHRSGPWWPPCSRRSEPRSGRRRSPAPVAGKPLNSPPSILFAIGFPVYLEIAILQHELAIATTETADVVLPAPFVLEVLTFDTVVAAAAEAPIELVIMAFAVRSVLVDVEGGRGEGLATLRAYKTGFVVAARQSAIRAGNGFAGDGQVAAFTITARRGGRRSLSRL